MGMSAGSHPALRRAQRACCAPATGWKLVGVEGLLPELDLLRALANRRFPVTWWIRRPDQIDYIAEPDLFHDLFGHVPLLMNPVFADYMQAYGARRREGARHRPDALQNLTRLYWYTVEFGLIRHARRPAHLRRGIVSSKGESLYCAGIGAPNRIGFDLERIMRTRYRIDTYQKTYFVIDSFEQLMNATAPDFTPIYARLARHGRRAGRRDPRPATRARLGDEHRRQCSRARHRRRLGHPPITSLPAARINSDSGKPVATMPLIAIR
jgi:phenylalanine-4-hydroxylase